MYTYRLNCMGPVSMKWYEKNGFTSKDKFTIDTDFKSKIWDKKIGEEYEVSRITQHYAGGRIDIRHPEDYNKEYGVPVMKDSSWCLFDGWLRYLKSEHLIEYPILIQMFEQETSHKIEWFEERL